MTDPKREAYAQHIKPLLDKIIAEAETHEINVFLIFMLDHNMAATYMPSNDPEDMNGRRMISELHAVLNPPPVKRALRD